MHWKRSNSHCNGNRRDKQGTENIVILCFDRRFTKQNSVIRLKSYIPPPKFFGLHQIFLLATPLAQLMRGLRKGQVLGESSSGACFSNFLRTSSSTARIWG